MQGTIYGDHCAYLIRTFWISLIAVLVGIVLIFILIGWFVIFATSIWFIFRVIYGFLKLHDDQSVTRTGWFM
ncbi:hypothetical protein ACFGXG_09755 [Pasteurella multocida]|uniref:hypothetical protein n=1 Tax=Pasteurella multocida TaxID=747 RepID=UPI000F6F96C3|nr:Predicted membrane protein [Pasteurella multocida subsp. septica]